MKKPNRNIPDLEVTDEPFLPGLEASEFMKYRKLSFAHGIARFTQVSNRDELPPLFLRIDEGELNYYPSIQFFRELDYSHGMDTAYSVLDEAGLFPSTFHGQTETLAAKLYDEIAARIDPCELASLTNQLEAHHNSGVGHDHRLDLLIALWADLYLEKLSEVWLAAMMNYALQVQQDEYVFGYLSAILDQKLSIEPDYLRGKRLVQNAAKGGTTNSVKHKKYRARILSAMRKLIDEGKNVSDAARTAKKRGYGTSWQANVKMWSRYGQSK